jgi:hypothetical protein
MGGPLLPFAPTTFGEYLPSDSNFNTEVDRSDRQWMIQRWYWRHMPTFWKERTTSDHRCAVSEGVLNIQFREYRTELTRDTQVMWTSDISLHRRPLGMLHRTSHISSHVKWSYTLFIIASVTDSLQVMPKEEGATQVSTCQPVERGDSRARYGVEPTFSV